MDEALSGTQAPERVPGTLTFAERVAYQHAMEDVYWRHRIWPKENSGSKPPLDAVISREQIENKVTEYLRKSQFVADHRGRPLTAGELQIEMDRMAKHTKRPEVLRELLAALGNDPFVIAECLVRPIVAEHLLAGSTVVAGVLPVPRSLFAAETAASTENHVRARSPDTSGYKLPEICAATECTDDTWTATSTVNAPDVRRDHTAVWTGSEMIVWGGFNNSPPYVLSTGGRYNPATDSWTATTTTKAPAGRVFHAAVWDGTEMIIWGGYNLVDCDLSTGGRYNTSSDTWTPTSTVNAPLARQYPTAVWTGSEMVVWAGRGCCNNCNLNSGGRYNPGTDSWTAISTSNAPEARWSHTVEWTGSEMIVWGGTNQTIYLNTGGRYNPNTDSWTPTGLLNVPPGRTAHTAVWTGTEMIVWGGVDETFNDTNTGGAYNPGTDSWIATTLTNAPSPRDSHTAVWTGNEMIVWAGLFNTTNLNTGGRYSPGTDSWTPTTTENVPLARYSHTAVWTGNKMIVWGGLYYPSPYLNTGGRYCAQSSATPTPTPTSTATATATPSATPGVTPTPRSHPTPHPRPTPPPRP